MADSNELLYRAVIVDDDEAFLSQASGIFRQEGCACDCIRTVQEASAALAESTCDLLVVETDIPGNRDLEFLENQAHLHGGLRAMIVTRNPSLNTAMKAVQLSAIDYLVKPIDTDSLIKSIRCALEKCKAIQAVRRARSEAIESLEQMALRSNNLENVVGRPEWYFAEAACQLAGLSIGMMNAVQSLATGARLKSHSESNSVWNSDVCRLMNCPRLGALESEVREAIEVLIRTKNAFKSKELADLRKRLTQVLHGSKVNAQNAPFDGKHAPGSS